MALESIGTIEGIPKRSRRILIAVVGFIVLLHSIGTIFNAITALYEHISNIDRLLAVDKIKSFNVITVPVYVSIYMSILSFWLCKRSIRLILGKKWAIETPNGKKNLFPIKHLFGALSLFIFTVLAPFVRDLQEYSYFDRFLCFFILLLSLSAFIYTISRRA